jgi:hypothetical protein
VPKRTVAVTEENSHVDIYMATRAYGFPDSEVEFAVIVEIPDGHLIHDPDPAFSGRGDRLPKSSVSIAWKNLNGILVSTAHHHDVQLPIAIEVTRDWVVEDSRKLTTVPETETQHGTLNLKVDNVRESSAGNRVSYTNPGCVGISDVCGRNLGLDLMTGKKRCRSN